MEEHTILMWSMDLMNPLTVLHSNNMVRENIFSAEGRSGSYRYLRRCLQVLHAEYPRDPTQTEITFLAQVVVSTFKK